jgi:hypothetical protein
MMATSVSDSVGTGGVNACVTTTVVNELLCFMQQKCMILPADQLVKICCDFYKIEEILAARDIIDPYAGVRLPKRQGNNKLTSTVEDIVKSVLQPKMKLPLFAACDLSRLPPVDIKHCDASAILLELQGLRSEVRDIAKIHDEVSSLKELINGFKAELPVLRSEVRVLQDRFNALSKHQTDVESLNLQSVIKPGLGASSTYASKAVASSGGLQQASRRAPKFAVGTSQHSKLQTAKMMKPVSIFITRLNPDTSCDDISANIIDNLDVLPGIHVDTASIQCERLKTRFDTYASFAATVMVDESVKDSVIEQLMSCEGWPKGVLVRKNYINMRSNGGQ